ncbi:MAG: hypothetical protein ABGW84_02990 [Sphingomonadaceae bacterium]
MNEEERQNSDNAYPSFPYHVIWPGYGNAEVSLRELRDNQPEYAALTQLASRPDFDAPFLSRNVVDAVSVEYGLTDDVARDAWLIGCFYLMPKQLKAFGLDPKRSKSVLLRAQQSAARLDQALEELSPKVLGALHYMRGKPVDEAKEEAPVFVEMHNQIKEFRSVALKAASDLILPEGRPRNHERNTMIRLYLELLKRNGLNDLVISSGTKARPDPHLRGEAGHLLLEWIKLIEPNWKESWIAPKVKAVRAQMQRSKTAG